MSWYAGTDDGLVELRLHGAVERVAAAQDVELEGLRAFEFGTVENVGDIVDARWFPTCASRPGYRRGGCHVRRQGCRGAPRQSSIPPR